MSATRHLLRSHGLAPQTQLPTLVYGTAWKKERTAELVYTAIRSGFRAIDTAAQPKHYREDLVGEGIRRAASEGLVKREDIYIQTKYTPVQSQNPRDMPYDASLSIRDQVKASIYSSLKNLQVPSIVPGSGAKEQYIDTLVFHSPLSTMEATIEAWNTAESFVPEFIGNLGISNCSTTILKALFDSPKIKIKPSVVQNRFYADTDYDVELRAFARKNGIFYQSFWTLTANPELAKSEPVQLLAQEAGVSIAVAMYSLVISLGNVSVLDGTTKEAHMKEDLESFNKIESFSDRNPHKWQDLVGSFKSLISESS